VATVRQKYLAVSKLDSAAVVFALSLCAMPVCAAEPPPPLTQSQEDAERALKEGFNQIFRALDSLIRSVPQYEMPEVGENGDIVIRRKKRPELPKRRAPADDEPSWT
jgi:hypothetical protein